MKAKTSMFVFAAPILSIGIFTLTTPNTYALPLIIVFAVALIGTLFLHCAFVLRTKFKQGSKTLATLAQVRRTLITFLDRREKRSIAEAFNNRYTYRKEWIHGFERVPGTAYDGPLPRGGYAWMCPDCNKIHQPISSSVMSGLQYPACCTTSEGHRLDDGIL